MSQSKHPNLDTLLLLNKESLDLSPKLKLYQLYLNIWGWSTDIRFQEINFHTTTEYKEEYKEFNSIILQIVISLAIHDSEYYTSTENKLKFRSFKNFSQTINDIFENTNDISENTKFENVELKEDITPYRMNTIKHFVEQCCIVVPDHEYTKFHEIYDAYLQWCSKPAPVLPMTRIPFSKILAKLGFKSGTKFYIKERKAYRIKIGIALKGDMK
jgi:hypothetical protein